MPREDGTDPTGADSMTGRAAGYCAGRQAPGSMDAAGGRGRGGRGCHGRRGQRHRSCGTGPTGRQPVAVNPEVTKEEELELLKNQAEHFGDALKEVNERIDQIESKASGKPSSKK